MIGHHMVQGQAGSEGVNRFIEEARRFAEMGETFAHVQTIDLLRVRNNQRRDRLFVPSTTIRLMENPIGLPIAKGSPLRWPFGRAIQQYREGGLIEHWRETAFNIMARAAGDQR